MTECEYLSFMWLEKYDKQIDEGGDAYSGNKNCPYEKDTHEYDAWWHGWECQKGH